ncbi:MAG TPA: helix-turn-helix domain-containing protein [Elusimicrobiota bacterium]|jgi:transcriptional regulator with XRE-family HTH domain|nr:helix-turn-helix domain-containing protein [Elusimicrobiota bacterium]
MSAASPAFSRLVAGAMGRRGLGLREVCRRAELDPSFFSKVLAGKRSPPSDEKALRRVAAALELDPVEVIVSAGLIPADWGALRSDGELVRAVNALVSGGRPERPAHAVPLRPRRASPPAAPRGLAAERAPAVVLPHRGLSEELL